MCSKFAIEDEIDLSTLEYEFADDDFDLIAKDVEERDSGKEPEPIYLVINERNLGGYDVWLNPQFNCAGGRKLNTIGMATLKEARDFCNEWKFNLAKNRYCVEITEYDEMGRRINVIPMPEFTYEELMNKKSIRRYKVVEYVSPTSNFPSKNKFVPEPKVVPELNEKSRNYQNTKLFRWYLGACKLNMRSHKFVSYVARKLNRKVSRQLTLQLVASLEKLSDAAKKNEEMQKLIKANFGTTEFPKLIDAIRIPSQGKNYR